VAPDEQVYEGMIVGESAQPLDLDVNVTKERKPVVAEISPEAGRPTVRLIPPRLLSLEQALEFVRDDELVEVTPRALRLRKRVLQAARRTRKT
jgi:GTP-binding protein